MNTLIRELFRCTILVWFLVAGYGCSADVEPANEGVAAGEAPVISELSDWQVVTIDNGAVLVDSGVSMILRDNGRLAGSTGCNAYFGQWSVDGANASFEAGGVTLMACPQPLMEQERRFLDALEQVTTLATGVEGGIALLDADDALRLELIPLESDAVAEESPLDLPSDSVHVYQCGDIGQVEFRFLGPDTIEVNTADDRYVMTSQRAASGARYAGDGAEFWNKGDEALLMIEAERYSCAKEDTDG